MYEANEQMVILLPENTINEDYNRILKKAREQPGITELLEVYGQYETVLRLSSEYLAGIKAKTVVSTTDSTTP